MHMLLFASLNKQSTVSLIIPNDSSSFVLDCFETVFDEFTPEYIFTITIPRGMSKDEENDIFMKMNFQMERYCKDNNMFSFLKDAYIIFE